MKRIALALFFLFVIVFGAGIVHAQSVYYVSASGDDKNDGASADRAFRSIDKVNKLTLKAGDMISFRRGDVFRGQLNIRQSGTAEKPIVIGSYGTGAKPVLSGAVLVSNWTKKSGNIWEADCPQCTDSVTGVYMDQLSLPLGRYPNPDQADNGYLKIQSHQGATQFTGQQSAAQNWTGAEAVIRTNDWIIDRLPIASQDGNTFNLEARATYELKDNWGYFIQNHPATLDENGEWYYDRANKKLLIWLSEVNPNHRQIEVTAYSRCVNIYAGNITVQDIGVAGALNIGIYGRNASGLTIANVAVTNMGEDGIVVNGSGEHITLKDNLITQINNDGIYVTGYSNFICQKNTVKHIGTEAGRGKSHNGQYVGIQYNYSGDDGASVIRNNELDSIGYIGISFNSANVTVAENVIGHFDLVKNDGGGIHTYNGKNHARRGNQIIRSNIIFKGIGSNPGTTDTYTGATGIYLDGGSGNIQVQDNTVFNCTGAGIFLHGSNNIMVNGNSCYDNNIQFLMTDDDQDGYDTKSNTISNNIFFNRNASQVMEKLQHHHAVMANERAFPNTLFKANPRFQQPGKNAPGDNEVLFEINRTNAPRNIKLSGVYKDSNNNIYKNEVVLKPYTSVILLKTGP